MSANDSTLKLPQLENRSSLDQLKLNLRNLIETGKIISAEIKRLEAENEKRFTSHNT